MNTITTKKISARKLFYLLLAFFIVSLIPLYLIGMYAHPSVDDYFYGTSTAALWKDTHSFAAVLRCCAAETAATYHDWQGNFAAIFLMRLQPGIFGEKYYFIAPLLLITAYAACSLFFFYTVMKKVFKTDKYRAGIVALSLTFVSMQLANVPSDSFYWYNGSVYYTFFYSLMLLLFALMVRISTAKGAGPAALLIFSIVLAFFIGGGNYATALFTSIILALAAGGSLYCVLRKKGGIVRHACFYCLIAAACITGLFLSMAAPGNAIRQASVGGSTNLVLTFIYTFAFGGYSLANVLSAPCIVFFVSITPIFYRIAKKAGFSYRLPLFLLIFTFGLYCSAGTPVFYAQGLRIPYRLMNIIYFSAYSLISFNLLYFLGWIGKKYGNTPLIKSLENMGTAVKKNRRLTAGTFILCVSAFFIACIGRIEVGETEYLSGKAGFSNLPMSLSAVYSLANGEAARYDAELTARDEYLSSSDENSIAVRALTAYPELIFHTDITTNPADWRNAHVAMFYHKNAVWIE